MNVTLMLGMDFLSFLVNGVLLAYFSNINVFKVMKSLQKDFWIVFAIAEGVFLMEVGIKYLKFSKRKCHFAGFLTYLYFLALYTTFHWQWI